MALIMLNGVAYSTPLVEIQNNSSATSLDALKIPTGQTITSVLNSNIISILNAIAPTNAVQHSNENANNFITNGVYCMATGNTNLPDAWGVLVCLAPRSDSIYQVYFRPTGYVWCRSRVNNTWSAWFKFTTTAV